MTDWSELEAVLLTERVRKTVGRYPETMGVRSLDRRHLGAAAVALERGFRVATFDRRLADAARSLGREVVGG